MSVLRRRLHSLALLLVTCVAWADDGPYVLPAATGWEAVSVVQSAQGPQRRAQLLAAGDVVTIPAVGTVPAFRVRLREAAKPGPDELRASSRAPLFVVADTHGEYEILVAQLRQHGIVDAALRWTFGRGRLVVLGDVFDRGPRHTEILWLLYQLEAEAAKAGGGVHLVLGNHEVMVLGGDLRYLHPRYLETTRVLGVRSYSELFDARTLLGQWLRTRPTIFKMDEQLFLHAGVSRALADSGLTLAQINDAIRALLAGNVPATDEDRRRAELLLGSLGPLWYRGYFPNQPSFPAASGDDLAQVLRRFGVRRILVGHTIVPTITPLYEGRVIAVQVYPRRAETGELQFESLLLEGGKAWRARIGGEREELPLGP